MVVKGFVENNPRCGDTMTKVSALVLLAFNKKLIPVVDMSKITHDICESLSQLVKLGHIGSATHSVRIIPSRGLLMETSPTCSILSVYPVTPSLSNSH